MIILLALKARRLSEDDLNGYIRHQIGIGQLTSLVSLSGQLVTPAAAERTTNSGIYRLRPWPFFSLEPTT